MSFAAHSPDSSHCMRRCGRHPCPSQSQGPQTTSARPPRLPEPPWIASVDVYQVRGERDQLVAGLHGCCWAVSQSEGCCPHNTSARPPARQRHVGYRALMCLRFVVSATCLRLARMGITRAVSHWRQATALEAGAAMQQEAGERLGSSCVLHLRVRMPPMQD